MAAVNFLYRSTRDTSELNLRLLYRFEDEDYVFGTKTKIVISKSNWSNIKSGKKITDANLKNKKLELDRDCAKIETYVLSKFVKTSPTLINKDWLKTVVNDFYNPKQKEVLPETVLDYFPVFLNRKRNKTIQRTLTRYGTVYNTFKRFVEFSGSNPLIEDVDPNFQSDFEDFCNEENYASSTTNKFIEVIKSLCVDARQNGAILSPRFELIKLRKKKNSVVYLNESDIDKLKSLNDSELGERLTRVKDWLLISCFTGQRVSDFLHFDEKNIRKVDGATLLDITQQKTNKYVTIPLLPEVLETLNKYNGRFPAVISEQKFNKYVKEVGEKAGINEPTYGGILTKIDSNKNRKVFGTYPKYELITSHIGRRSFATNLYGKFPTPLIMNVTGHSKESTFLEYIGKTSGDLAIDLAKKYSQTKN